MLIIICMIHANGISQRGIYIGDQNTGRPYTTLKTERIDGSPYLFNEWKAGRVKLKNGLKYDSLQLKFDAFLNKVFYNHNDSLYEFLHEVAEFDIYPNINAQPYTFYQLRAEKSFKPGTFVQVLARGKITVIKYYLKEVDERKEYGSPIVLKEYRDRSSSFILANGEVYPAKYSAKLLDEIITDKSREINLFINNKDLNLKKEAGFLAAVQYYNSL